MEVKATMVGMVWQHNVSVGQKVRKGQDILTMEVMKTEMPVPSPCKGVVEWVEKQGKQVKRGAIIARVKEDQV